MPKRKRSIEGWAAAHRKRVRVEEDERVEPQPSTSRASSPPPPSAFQGHEEQLIAAAHVTSAARRNELLLEKVTATDEVSEENALVVISVKRLKELLSGKMCDVCGEETQTNITHMLFDCEGTVKCNKCDVVMCESKPQKTGFGNLTEANSIQYSIQYSSQ